MTRGAVHRVMDIRHRVLPRKADRISEKLRTASFIQRNTHENKSRSKLG